MRISSICKDVLRRNPGCTRSKVTTADFELFCSQIVSMLGLGLKPRKDIYNCKNDIKLTANICEFKFQHYFWPVFVLKFVKIEQLLYLT